MWDRLHTKEGARVAMLALIHGTAKDRKAILKSFKTYVAKVGHITVPLLKITHIDRSAPRSTVTLCFLLPLMSTMTLLR